MYPSIQWEQTPLLYLSTIKPWWTEKAEGIKQVQNLSTIMWGTHNYVRYTQLCEVYTIMWGIHNYVRYTQLCEVYTIMWGTHNKVKIQILADQKQSLYRSGKALRFPGVWSSQISRQLVHEGGKVVRLRTGRIYTQEIFLVLISVGGWIDLRTIVQPEGLYQWKITVTP